MQLASLLAVLLFVSIACSQGFDIRDHLATKAPYRPLQTSGYTPAPNTCKPRHFNYLARHGSRQATSDKTFTRVEQYFAQSNNGKYITNPAYLWLNNWVSPFGQTVQGLLTYYGQVEHYQTARNYRKLFPEILEHPYDPLTYSIQSTQVSRTGISGSAFTFGLFEGRGNLTQEKYSPVFIYSDSANEDFNLRFFDNCPTYVNFQNTPAPKVQNVLNEENVAKINPNISRILGPEMSLDSSIVADLWDTCRYGIASFNSSQFCSLFDEQTNSVLEYNEDLKYYYKEGYGFEINYNISVILLQDFFQTMEDAINGKFQQKARLRFAHAETVIPFISILGLYRDDEPLKYDSEWKDSRKWRTSVISNFASNVAFVLYECGSSSSPTYTVKLLHNEKEMPFPGCNGQMYCPLDTLAGIYREKLSLNFTNMCDYSDEEFQEEISRSTNVILFLMMLTTCVFVVSLISVLVRSKK